MKPGQWDAIEQKLGQVDLFAVEEKEAQVVEEQPKKSLKKSRKRRKSNSFTG